MNNITFQHRTTTQLKNGKDLSLIFLKSFFYLWVSYLFILILLFPTKCKQTCFTFSPGKRTRQGIHQKIIFIVTVTMIAIPFSRLHRCSVIELKINNQRNHLSGWWSISVTILYQQNQHSNLTCIAICTQITQLLLAHEDVITKSWFFTDEPTDHWCGMIRSLCPTQCISWQIPHSSHNSDTMTFDWCVTMSLNHIHSSYWDVYYAGTIISSINILHSASLNFCQPFTSLIISPSVSSHQQASQDNRHCKRQKCNMQNKTKQ